MHKILYSIRTYKIDSESRKKSINCNGTAPNLQSALECKWLVAPQLITNLI